MAILPEPAAPPPTDAYPFPAFTREGPVVAPSSPYQNEKKLLDLHLQLKDEAWENRIIYERGWWRLLLYVLGRQWIYLEQSRGQWMDKRLPKWVPRPVTNKMNETVATIRSVFQSVQLQTKCRPNGLDPKDVTTAETADRLEPSIRREHELDDLIPESDFWYITLGNVFWHTWWDKRAGTGTLVPFEQCLACGAVSAPDEIQQAGGVCPACGQAQLGPALGPDGQPQGLLNVQGAGQTDVCSPFEIAIPPGYTTFKDISYLYRCRWRTKAYYETHHPKLAKRLHFDRQPAERSLQLLRALAQTNDISTPMGYPFQGASATLGEGIAEYELWLKPSREYPDGLFLRVAGDGTPEIVVDESSGTPGPLPYHDAKGNPIFPWIHAGYEHMGGRIWARSLLESGVQKQDQINQIDSLAQLIVQRVANPVWLEPKGSEVKKFTGEPGLVLKYNPSLSASGAKPERIPGENVPPSVLALRNQFVADFEALMGTSDILKGSRPPNIEAFSALQLLVERSQARFAPALQERGKLYRDWYRLALELEREFGPDTRLNTVLGPNQTWSAEEFRKADLMGSIEVIIEDGSQTPKTSLGKRAAIEQLNQLGFIDKNDAEQRYAVFRIFGQTDLLPSLDNNVKSAQQEQDAFERWAKSPESTPAAAILGAAGLAGPMPSVAPEGQPGQSPLGAPVAPTGGGPLPAGPPQPPEVSGFLSPFPMVVQYWHDDAIHNAEHRKYANSDSARQLFAERPDLVQPFTLHMQGHDFSAAKKQAETALTQQMAVQSVMQPQGAGLAMRNSNRESGNPADVPHGQSEAVQGRGPE